MNEYQLIDWPEVVTKDHLDLRPIGFKDGVFSDRRSTAIGERFRHLDGRITLVASELDQRMRSMETRIDTRFAEVIDRFDNRFDRTDQRRRLRARCCVGQMISK